MGDDDQSGLAGVVGAYLHPGWRLAAMVEVACRTETPQAAGILEQATHELAMHIAAVAPLYYRREDVPADVAKAEWEVAQAVAARQFSDPARRASYVAERMARYYAQVCLLEQPFIKDMTRTIGEMIDEWSRRVGAPLAIVRFARYQLGEPRSVDGTSTVVCAQALAPPGLVDAAADGTTNRGRTMR